jgi:hypothetical protein
MRRPIQMRLLDAVIDEVDDLLGADGPLLDSVP